MSANAATDAAQGTSEFGDKSTTVTNVHCALSAKLHETGTRGCVVRSEQFVEALSTTSS
jgi:hypothetical protein